MYWSKGLMKRYHLHVVDCIPQKRGNAHAAGASPAFNDREALPIICVKDIRDR